MIFLTRSLGLLVRLHLLVRLRSLNGRKIVRLRLGKLFSQSDIWHYNLHCNLHCWVSGITMDLTQMLKCGI